MKILNIRSFVRPSRSHYGWGSVFLSLLFICLVTAGVQAQSPQAGREYGPLTPSSLVDGALAEPDLLAPPSVGQGPSAGMVQIMATAATVNEGLVPDSVERQALVDIYNSMGGSSWTRQDNWLQGTTSADFDTWFGIEVRNGDVYKIDLKDNNLTGSIPSSIGDFRGLHTLRFLYNNITGPIPPSLGRLANLVFLYLDHNQLNGTLPTELGDLGNTQYISIGSNMLHGSIPESLGNLIKLSMGTKLC